MTKPLPTYEEQQKANHDKYMELVKTADPELYMVKIALEETKIDPSIIVHVIRALGNLSYGHGYGKVQIYMQAKVISNIESVERIKISEE